MVRFAWRADIGKKTKVMVCPSPHIPLSPFPSSSTYNSVVLNSHSPIYASQRRVKFPLELDALDLVTEELRAKMLPASRRLMEIEKERAERRKVRKRMKTASAAPTTTAKRSEDVEMAAPDTSASAGGVATAAVANSAGATEATAGGEDAKGKGKVVAAGELEEESVYREREVAELSGLVEVSLKEDIGCSVSGFYELVGEFVYFFLRCKSITAFFPVLNDCNAYVYVFQRL
jgi:hypothetical protein